MKTALIEAAKKYLSWYIYPLVYLVTISLFCIVAWFRGGDHAETAVQIIFKVLAVVPTLVWAGLVTIWIVLVTIYTLLLPDAASVKKPKRSPGSSGRVRSKKLESPGKDISKSLKNPFVRSLAIMMASLLIFSGIALFIWMARPYITLLLFSSKIGVLEQKVRAGKVEGNRIIIPAVLVDAPIVEGITADNLSRGVSHEAGSAVPGKGGNCIIEGHNLAEFGFFSDQNFFSLLEIVKKGTPIFVYYGGRKFVYKVDKKAYHDVGSPELYDNKPGERLTLITCVSTWSPTIYTKRRTVITASPEF